PRTPDRLPYPTLFRAALHDAVRRVGSSDGSRSGNGPFADLLRDALRALRIANVERNGGAAFMQPFGHGTAQAARCAGDDRDTTRSEGHTSELQSPEKL